MAAFLPHNLPAIDASTSSQSSQNSGSHQDKMTLTVSSGSGEKYQGPPLIAGIASHRIYQALLFSQPHIIIMIRSELPPRFPRRTDLELLFD